MNSETLELYINTANDDEVIDIEYFRAKALEFGFDEKEYFEALS